MFNESSEENVVKSEQLIRNESIVLYALGMQGQYGNSTVPKPARWSDKFDQWVAYEDLRGTSQPLAQKTFLDIAITILKRLDISYTDPKKAYIDFKYAKCILKKQEEGETLK